MKRIKLLGWALLALTSITSCSNHTEEILTQEYEIKLTSEITPSRVTSWDYQSTQIVEGQQVGVTITDAKSEHNNVAWSVGETGVLTNTSVAIYYGNGTATITAYHPYNSSWTGKSHEFSVSTNQSDEENYRNSDLLWATTASSKADKAIPLIFTHKLAKINIKLVPEKEGTDLNNATISICNTKISATFNPMTGELSDAIGEPQEIEASVTAGNIYTASAIVIPQEIPIGKFIKITHGNKTYYYTLSEAIKIESGDSYNYTLTMTGDEEEIETIPNNQIWYTSSDGNIVTPFATNDFGANLVSNVYKDGKGIISFDSDVTTIGYQAFFNCTSLTGITIPNSVVNIKDAAFAFCNSLINIIIPNSVTSIENQAFEGCINLQSITIPKSVTTIGENVFTGAYSLTRIIVEEGNLFYDSRENCNAIIKTKSNSLIRGCNNTTIPKSVTSIEFNAFEGCSFLTNVKIPDNVTSIGGGAFSYCNNLTSFTVHNNLTEIGYNPFPLCNSLTSIIVEQDNPVYDSREGCNAIIETSSNTLIGGCKNTIIPSSVSAIGLTAFYGLSSLTYITIPNSVTKIEEGAFMLCSSLARIDIEATIPPTIFNNTFLGCNSNLKIYVPAASLEAYKATDYWKDLNIYPNNQ